MLRQYIILEHILRSRREQLIARHNEGGATAVEYGLLVVLIAAIIVGVVATLGTKIKAGFTTVNTALT